MKNLNDKKVSEEFYDTRYEEGYMEEWDEGKKNKVREIIKTLPLPAQGKALDFGCGNGVFTVLLKECLPHWEVFGAEISKVAVANAKKKYPSCHFFWADEAANHYKAFDFLFSHHVIEHVQNLDETFGTINSYLKDNAYQLHILPCGNAGSLEHEISRLVKNGIEKEKGNRFFFEEPGHLRRLTSKEFEDCEGKIGFRLVQGYFANQYHGAVNWITKSSPRFVKKLTNFNDAATDAAKQKLKILRKKLLPLTYLQFPYSKYWAIKSKWRKKPKDYVLLSGLFLPAQFSKIVFDKLENESATEWQQKKHDARGSEMYLFFKR